MQILNDRQSLKPRLSQINRNFQLKLIEEKNKYHNEIHINKDDQNIDLKNEVTNSCQSSDESDRKIGKIKQVFLAKSFSEYRRTNKPVQRSLIKDQQKKPSKMGWTFDIIRNNQTQRQTNFKLQTIKEDKLNNSSIRSQKSDEQMPSDDRKDIAVNNRIMKPSKSQIIDDTEDQSRHISPVFSQNVSQSNEDDSIHKRKKIKMDLNMNIFEMDQINGDEFKLGYNGAQFDDKGNLKEYSVIGKGSEFLKQSEKRNEQIYQKSFMNSISMAANSFSPRKKRTVKQQSAPGPSNSILRMSQMLNKQSKMNNKQLSSFSLNQQQVRQNTNTSMSESQQIKKLGLKKQNESKNKMVKVRKDELLDHMKYVATRIEREKSQMNEVVDQVYIRRQKEYVRFKNEWDNQEKKIMGLTNKSQEKVLLNVGDRQREKQEVYQLVDLIKSGRQHGSQVGSQEYWKKLLRNRDSKKGKTMVQKFIGELEEQEYCRNGKKNVDSRKDFYQKVFIKNQSRNRCVEIVSRTIDCFNRKRQNSVNINNSNSLQTKNMSQIQSEDTSRFGLMLGLDTNHITSTNHNHRHSVGYINSNSNFNHINHINSNLNHNHHNINNTIVSNSRNIHKMIEQSRFSYQRRKDHYGKEVEKILMKSGDKITAVRCDIRKRDLDKLIVKGEEVY